MKIIKSNALNIISFFQVSSTTLLRYAWTLFIGKIELKNEPEIDNDSTYLFVSNHATYLDVYAIFMGMKFRNLNNCAPTRFMTAAFVYFSFLRPIIMLGGGFPAKNPQDPTYKSVDKSIYYLKHGQNVVIFPEGGRIHRVDGKAHRGVKLIADGYGPGLNIMLVKLSWVKTRWRRHLIVSYEPATEIVSPDQTMERIYSL